MHKYTTINMFDGSKPHMVASYKGIEVQAHRFSTGVPYLEIANERGEARLLPYRGHQVWSAVFDECILGMESLVKEPSLNPCGQDISLDFETRSNQYLADYGALLVHCGPRRMGCPDKPEDHPLHGDLPLMNFSDPVVKFEQDQKGVYVEIIGFSDDTITKGTNNNSGYFVRVKTRIYASEALVHTETTTFKAPRIFGKTGELEYMFLEHANHRKIYGGRLVFCPDLANLRVREKDPDHIQNLLEEEQAAYSALKAAAVENPAQFFKIDLKHEIYPELVLYGEQQAAKEAVAAQVRPDGFADVTIYSPEQLKQMIIWMRDATDEQAEREKFAPTNSLGLLPATGLPQGFNDAQRMNEVGTVLKDRTVNCAVGLLNPQEARARIPDLEKRLAA